MRTMPFAVLALMTASVASAQDGPVVPANLPVAPAPAATPSVEPTCELHIWPAERFQAMTTGWGAGFGLIGALADAAGHANGDKARRANLAAALDPEGQVTALQQLDLVKLLGLKPSKIVTHTETLDPKTLSRTHTRRAASGSPCYSELVVTGVLYHKAAIYGRSLKTAFWFRDFGSATQQSKKYTTMGGNGLKLFPPKEGEDVTASNQELAEVFKKNFTEAAGNFARQRAR